MKKYNTIIWDLDGTLLDTLVDLMNAVNHALTEFGYPTRTLEDIRVFVGNGVKVLMELSLPNGRENPDYDAAFQCFSEYYAQHNMDNTRPYDGVVEAIQKLSELGIKQAIVSNKVDEGVRVLNERFFGVPVTVGVQEGLERKPSGEMVWHAMDLLGADVDTTVYIGDSEVDIATARNSGLDQISVLWGFRTAEDLAPHNPMMTVSAPSEIVEIFK